jgi:DNA-binding LytR/AlgR family response regulator
MKVLLIEDEEPAAQKLSRQLKSIEPDIVVIDVLVSIEESVRWLKAHPAPDLIFMDIQLSDGSSFEIFKEVKVEAPVIFTTAYDQYAVQAFKVNSIDYLLKPITKEDLVQSLNKFKNSNLQAVPDYSHLLRALSKEKEYQKRLLIKYGATIKTLNVDDAAYFYTEDKVVYVSTRDKNQFPVDYNLEQLQQLLSPEKFFRINRQFIINIDAIDKMVAYSKSRVKVKLNPHTEKDTIVSTERSADFKKWLSGELSD